MTTILEMGPTVDDNWPTIDYDDQRNQFDWPPGLGGGEFQQSFYDSVNLTVPLQVGQVVDALAFNMIMLLISRRAMDLLASLEKNLQFGRMRVNETDFFLLYKAPVIDCIDRKLTQLGSWARRSNPSNYFFDVGRVAETAIFSVPDSSMIFCVETVKSAVVGHGLTGFAFRDTGVP